MSDSSKRFFVDWLGRSGPNEMVVDLPLEEARARLEMSLVAEESESWGQALFQQNRRYAGKIRGDAFDLIALWRNRRSRPTLTGRFEPLEDGTTRIHFQVHMDPNVLVIVIVPWFILTPILIAVFLSGLDTTILPIATGLPLIFVMIIVGANLLFSRLESSYLLEFFVGLYRKS